MFATELATKVREHSMAKLRIIGILYLAVAVMIGLLVPMSFDPLVANITAAVLLGLFFYPFRKARAITKVWTGIRGFHIEANPAARNAFQRNKGYLLDLLAFLIIGAAMYLVYINSVHPVIPMYTLLQASGLPLLVALLDWKHDVVTTREYMMLRKKEVSDSADMIMDWPAAYNIV